MTEPRCALGDDRTFVFIHDCLEWQPPDADHPERWLSPTVAEERRLPLEIGGSDPQAGWVWVGVPGDTIHPSIHCTRCGTHGFWRDRTWVSV